MHDEGVPAGGGQSFESLRGHAPFFAGAGALERGQGRRDGGASSAPRERSNQIWPGANPAGDFGFGDGEVFGDVRQSAFAFFRRDRSLVFVIVVSKRGGGSLHEIRSAEDIDESQSLVNPDGDAGYHERAVFTDGPLGRDDVPDVS